MRLGDQLLRDSNGDTHRYVTLEQFDSAYYEQSLMTIADDFGFGV